VLAASGETFETIEEQRAAKPAAAAWSSRCQERLRPALRPASRGLRIHDSLLWDPGERRIGFRSEM